MTHGIFKIFRAVVVTAGGGAMAFALARLPHQHLDYRYLLLLIAMATVASRLSISIPHVKGEVTVGDTLVFLTLMFYGGEAAIVMAAVDGLSSSLRVSRKARVWLFNSSQMALSTCLTVWVLHLLFGSIIKAERGGFSLTFFATICVMFFVQYITNSGLVATYTALKTQQPIFVTWRTSYLWTSISYLAGACIAGLSAQFLQGLSIYTVFMITPIVAIVYLTYKTYLRNVQSSLTQAKEAERHAELLEASEERFRSAFNHASIGMALVSEDGKWLQVNHALSQILGYSNDELLASNIQSLTHPDDLGDLLIQQARLAKGEIPRYQSEKRYIHKAGQEIWTLLSVSPVRDAETSGLRFIFQLQDISERKRAEAQLIHDAFHDTLTGLPNRALFVDHLKLAVARHRRRRYPVFSVLFLDLDRFKVVNDSLGHLIGDQLLIEVARRIQKSLRPGDTIARFGGDEFTLLLEDLHTESEAIQIAERILRELALPFDIGGREVFTSASIGLSPSTIGYKHAEDMLRDADTAMYCAKASGGGYQTFDKTMHARAVETLETQNDLRQAISRNELLVYYQPIVLLDTFQIEGFEALLRWKHPKYGLISPNQFIPLAEETGVITSLGAWILREACSQLRQWQERHPSTRPLTMSVNVSGKQLADPDFIKQVQEAINDNNLPPHSLKLEITESAVVQNVDTAREMLKAIRALGATISIDDFGTGYSSLSMLHKFPISTLKIDSSFVRRIGAEDDNTEIIRTIMALAKNLAMDVTAEGVETLDQVTKLRSLGCEFGQGYFFSRPVPAPDAATLLIESAGSGVTTLLGDNVQSLRHRLVA